MARIEGIGIQNFKVLKDITLGRLVDKPDTEPLTPVTAVIGKNGVGKSALFDAFGFLADCLKSGVEEACYARGRGGFAKIISQGQTELIEFEVLYREHADAQPIAYRLAIDVDESGRPYVLWELLSQESNNQDKDRRTWLLIMANGKGIAWKGDEGGAWKEGEGWHPITGDKQKSDLFKVIMKDLFSEQDTEVEDVELDDNRKLGIATLGALKQHPRIVAFRRFMEQWYLSYFTPNAARSLPLAGPQPHLNSQGDNLGNVVQFMQREHRLRFKSILQRIATKIPGIDRIDTEETSDGRLLLRFRNHGFQKPFYAQHVSDGTLKVFAYLLLLEDPAPPPLLCIEEPENGLYPKLLETLADEFRAHATEGDQQSQVFITTHQPYFVDALSPNEVWVLDKGADGFATIRCASDDPLVQNMADQGLPLGSLWYSDYLDND